ncbi:MAG: hypothetical protein A2Z35_06200 [Actinobacteria bacterium RBG_19FT_COMBO_36_27]|nr:MAG: hypothetical protein A2Z35_06200 [Actinobacteria bacterium RBG_19FT_COMBO_36_27]
MGIRFIILIYRKGGITMADKIIINNSRPGSQINIVSGNAKINASQTIITSKNETTIVNNKDVKK